MKLHHLKHISVDDVTHQFQISPQEQTENLNYIKIIKHYLDEDTNPDSSYLTDTQCEDTGMCSNVEIKKVICAANIRAHEEQEKRKDGEWRLIWSEGFLRLIPRSERSVQVKIARKIHAAQRQKKNLDGLYEVLAPGSAVRKISPPTSLIKEPKWPEVRVWNSDIAKLGT